MDDLLIYKHIFSVFFIYAQKKQDRFQAGILLSYL